MNIYTLYSHNHVNKVYKNLKTKYKFNQKQKQKQKILSMIETDYKFSKQIQTTWTNKKFHCKAGYIYFCKFEIFAIEAAEIIKEYNKKICDTFDHNFKNIPKIMSYMYMYT